MLEFSLVDLSALLYTLTDHLEHGITLREATGHHTPHKELWCVRKVEQSGRYYSEYQQEKILFCSGCA